MRKTFVIVIISFSTLGYSQIGINTSSPKATFDVMAGLNDNTKADGIIAPRLTGNVLRTKDALYTNEQTGVVIYVTEAATPTTSKTINVTSPGYYYFDGSLWQRFVEASTNPATNVANGLTAVGNNMKLGGVLTESTQIATGTNNISFTGNGKIGVGTSAPAEKLDIIGKLKITDGTQGVNRILRSDANGVARWEVLPVDRETVVSTSFTDATNFNGTDYRSMGSITLPRGKWIVSWTLNLGCSPTSQLQNVSYHINSELSSSPTGVQNTGFTVIGGRFGTLTGFIQDTTVQTAMGQIRGATIVDVSVSSVVLYIVSKGNFGSSLPQSRIQFLASYGENQMNAIPVN